MRVRQLPESVDERLGQHSLGFQGPVVQRIQLFSSEFGSPVFALDPFIQFRPNIADSQATVYLAVAADRAALQPRRLISPSRRWSLRWESLCGCTSHAYQRCGALRFQLFASH